MYFNSNLIKTLFYAKNKDIKKCNIKEIIENKDYLSLRKKLKNTEIDVNNIVENNDIDFDNKRIGYDLMKYHFKKTGCMTKNENFNIRFFSVISSQYIKKHTNNQCKNKYEIRDINYKSGQIII